MRPFLPLCSPARWPAEALVSTSGTGTTISCSQRLAARRRVAWRRLIVELLPSSRQSYDQRGARPSGSAGRGAAGLALGAGAVLFAGTLAAHGDAWPGPACSAGCSPPALGAARVAPGDRGRPRAADRPRGARSADCLPRRGGAGARRARRAASPARLVALALLAWLAWLRAAARREQATPACAFCAVLGRPRSRYQAGARA